MTLIVKRRPVFSLYFVIALILSGACVGAASAATEFCPSTIAGSNAVAPDGTYTVRLGAASARTVTGEVRVQTAAGWYAAPFSKVAIAPAGSGAAVDASGQVLDYLSAPLTIRLPSATPVLYAYVNRAAATGDTVMGWDKYGEVMCDPPGRPKNGTMLVPAPAFTADAAKSIALNARTIEPPFTDTCKDPFSLVHVTELARARYPSLYRDAGFTALPAGFSAIAVAVDRTGKVLDDWLMHSSGVAALDNAAATAAVESKYAPAHAFCSAVPGFYFMRVRFGR